MDIFINSFLCWHRSNAFCYPYRDILHAFLRLLFRSSPRAFLWLTLYVFLGGFQSCYISSSSRPVKPVCFIKLLSYGKYFLYSLLCGHISTRFWNILSSADLTLTTLQKWPNKVRIFSLTAIFWGHGFATPQILLLVSVFFLSF